MSSNNESAGSKGTQGGCQAKPNPENVIKQIESEVTLTDKLNKKLLTSFLDQLNESNESMVVVQPSEEEIPDDEFNADCTPQDIRKSVLAQKK